MTIQIIKNERWKKINTILPNIKEEYEISDHGRVYNAKTHTMLKSWNSKKRYPIVSLYTIDGENYTILVHILVGLAFIGNRPNGKSQIDHIDTFHDNNHYTNLEWVTSKENIRRAFNCGLRNYQIGENHHFNVYTELQIHEICRMIHNGITKPKYIIREVFGECITEQEQKKYQRLIKHIKHGDQWVSISSLYNIIK